jgi:hypothetical protein
MKVRRGDRVRMVAGFAEQMMKSANKRVDWLARRGVVIRASSVTDTATIKWDDRATTDCWPIRAVERAS